jgi:hypothetical protein
MTDLRLVTSNLRSPNPLPPTARPPTSLTSPESLPKPRLHGFEPSQRLLLHAKLNRLIALQPECEPMLTRIISRMLDSAELIDAARNATGCHAPERETETDRQVLLPRR